MQCTSEKGTWPSSQQRRRGSEALGPKEEASVLSLLASPPPVRPLFSSVTVHAWPSRSRTGRRIFAKTFWKDDPLHQPTCCTMYKGILHRLLCTGRGSGSGTVSPPPDNRATCHSNFGSCVAVDPLATSPVTFSHAHHQLYTGGMYCVFSVQGAGGHEGRYIVTVLASALPIMRRGQEEEDIIPIGARSATRIRYVLQAAYCRH